MNKDYFRNYSNVSENIKNNYLLARKYQTTILYSNILSKFEKREKKICYLWDIMDKLNSFIDISDPDISLPNSQHMFQAAEESRKNNEPRWFQLVCLIHDLGKIQAFIDNNEDNGLSIKKQWAIVGDTFILGCKIPESIIFPEFNSLNNEYNSKDKYEKNCGLNNTMVSWGHDEFLYRVLMNNNHSLPEEALYIIRFHSLYLWHKENEYSHLENETDKEMKPWVQRFNKYDLYTKEDTPLDIEKLKMYYTELFIEYFGTINIII
jgi:inositol oxygenase